MKISVLLYLCGDESEKKLETALFSAGFRVCRIGNLSNLHTILESRSFDAVFLSRKTLRLYCISASRHLWQARSPHTIIDWEAMADGSVSFGVHRVPSSVTGIAETPDRGQKLEAITEVLERIDLADNLAAAAARAEQSEPETQQSLQSFDLHRENKAAVDIPPGITVGLHAKLKIILETIAATGATGIGVAALEQRIWGEQGRNRKKDIQIYVSKLRKALKQDGIARFTIPYENRRYYLRKQA